MAKPFRPPVGEGGNFKSPETGDHIVRFRGYIDLGTIKDPKYGTLKREIKLLFELVETNETLPVAGVTKDNQPFEMSKKFTFSLSEKANFRKFIESWKGAKYKNNEELEKFDLNLYAEKQWPGMIIVEEIEKEGKTFNVINNIMPLPKSVNKANVPALRNPTICFRIDDKETHKSFKLFSHRTKDLDRLKQCQEYKEIAYLFKNLDTTASTSSEAASADDDEDLPY